MTSKFEYDDEGSTFFVFLLSFQALVIIPCTYYFYPRSDRNEKRDKSVCHCYNCNVKNQRLRAKEPWRKVKSRSIKFLLLIGWTSLILTLYKVYHLQHDYVAYDPFEILEIDADASTAEIKKAYRRLSLIYHPDKDSGDDKKFMRIAKAYAALTDSEARHNWEIYGHPSGPGAMSFGIALPSWIVEKENSVYVLSLYALVFMVALPVAVGVWWYRSLQYGSEQILLDTTQLYMYFIFKTPHMILKRVLMVIAASMEFRKSYNREIVERPSDNLEVPQLIKELSNLGEKNREKPLCFSYSIKARAIIHAHLSRIKLPNTLEEDRLFIVKKLPFLIHEFVQCVSQLTMLALAGRISRMPNLHTMENAMSLCPCIVQGLWDNKSPLLQLPHINEELLRHFSTRKRNIRSIKNLASMKALDRRNMLRSLSDYQYDDVMNVLGKMPLIDVEVKSEVLDDEDCTITAGAIVTVTATLHRRDMSSIFDEEECHDELVDEVEDELPASNNLQKSKLQKKKPKKSNKKTGKSSSQLKKKSAKASTKKTDLNGVCNGLPQVKTNLDKHKEKDERERESAGESDVDDESASLNASSDENTEISEKKIAEKTPVDKDKDKDGEDAEWEKFQAKVTNREKILESKSKISHTVHCPNFPEEKEEYWWIYVVNKKQHVLITAPYLVTNLVKQEEVELKFTAPSRPGIYTYSVLVRSDSYFDCDFVKTIKLDVKEAKEIDLSKLQWDVSEEEEEKDEEESAVSDSDLASDGEIDED